MAESYGEELFISMEALALLFVIGAFIALLLPEVKPPPPSAGDTLMKGLKAAYKEMTGGGGGGGGKKSDPTFWESPWTVILFTILLGILFTYVL